MYVCYLVMYVKYLMMYIQNLWCIFETLLCMFNILWFILYILWCKFIILWCIINILWCKFHFLWCICYILFYIYIYRYILPLIHTSLRTMERMAARPIALTHVQSSDHLISRAILLHFLTNLAFIVQHSHTDTIYIARFNAIASHKRRFKPLSRLAQEHFTTLFNWNFLNSHELSHTLHDLSHTLHELSHTLHELPHSLHAFSCSHQVS